jgi:hypothetical protein
LRRLRSWADPTKPRKARRRPRQLEHAEQVLVAKWLRAARIAFTAVPNAAMRSVIVASMLKAEGMSPGFPDVLIFDAPPARPEFIGAAIEMKRADGLGTATEEQEQWLIALAARGWATKVCHGAADALAWLAELGYRVPH